MVKIMELGLLNKKMLLLLSYPVIILLRTIFIEIIERQSLIKTYPYEYLLDGLGSLLAIIPYIILRRKIKSMRNKNNDKRIEDESKEIGEVNVSYQSSNRDLLYEGFLKKLKRESCRQRKFDVLYTAIICFILSFSYLFDFLYVHFSDLYTTDSIFYKPTMDILFCVVFNFIFKKRTFLHQNVSLFFIFVIMIILSVYDLKFLNRNGEREWYIRALVDAFIAFFEVLGYTLGNKYFINNFGSPYLLMFWDGITHIIVYLIIEPIYYYVNPLRTFNEPYDIIGLIYFNNYMGFTKSFIIYSVLHSILFFMKDLFAWLIIYYFSLTHFIISIILGTFFQVIVLLIFIFFDIKKANFLILLFIALFFSLIFNEILIVLVCRMNYNTRKYILLREENEKFSEKGKDAILDPNEEDIYFSDSDEEILPRGILHNLDD